MRKRTYSRQEQLWELLRTWPILEWGRPTTRRLAARMYADERTVKRWIRWLIEHGRLPLEW